MSLIVALCSGVGYNFRHTHTHTHDKADTWSNRTEMVGWKGEWERGREHDTIYKNVYFYLFSIGIVPTPVCQHCRRHDSVFSELKICSKVLACRNRGARCHIYGVRYWCSLLGHRCYRWYCWCECLLCTATVRHRVCEASAVPMCLSPSPTSMWWPLRVCVCVIACATHRFYFKQVPMVWPASKMCCSIDGHTHTCEFLSVFFKLWFNVYSNDGN